MHLRFETGSAGKLSEWENMKIASVSNALPPHYYRQEQIAEALKRQWADRLENPQVLDRLLTRVGVNGRHLALPLEDYSRLSGWGQANNAWIDAALDLAEQSLCRALKRGGYAKTDLGAIFFSSVTGIASPSIEARLINRMGLPTNIKRIPIFGLGCVAGAAGISRAADYVRAYPDQVAALVCVELCSLTWQREDMSVANIISSGLFGDGAAAVLVAGRNVRGDGPEILGTRSVFYPDTEKVMGWDISEKGFRIVLSSDVPEMVRRHLANDVDSFLAEHGMTRGDIGSWIMHTGGPKVLDATAEALQIPASALESSWTCLREVGNLSSVSVLMVLDNVLTSKRPAPGTFSILAAMGPGFCSELVLLQW